MKERENSLECNISHVDKKKKKKAHPALKKNKAEFQMILRMNSNNHIKK